MSQRLRNVVNHQDLEWTTEGSPNGKIRFFRIVNDSGADFVFLCMSTMITPDVVLYPDSGRIGVFVGVAPGGRPEQSVLKRLLDAGAED